MSHSGDTSHETSFPATILLQRASRKWQPASSLWHKIYDACVIARCASVSAPLIFAKVRAVYRERLRSALEACFDFTPCGERINFLFSSLFFLLIGVIYPITIMGLKRTLKAFVYYKSSLMPFLARGVIGE